MTYPMAAISIMGLHSHQHDDCFKAFVADSGKEFCQLVSNGPYSLLVRASYFISCSVHARFSSITFIDCKWHWECRHF